MSRVRHLGNRAFDAMLKESGIDAFSGAQGKILYVLWENGRLTITEIARLTSLAKTTLTTMLDRMERMDLIRRVPDPKNRRQIHIELTDKAVTLQKDYDRVSDRINELYYEGITEEEIALFEDILRRIIKNLERSGPS